MRFAIAILPALLLIGCVKNDPPGPSSSGGPYAVAPHSRVWFVFDGDTVLLEPGLWQFTSAYLTQFDDFEANCTVLQDAVVVNVAHPVEQWHFGFVGTFIDQFGVDPTRVQRASLASVGHHSPGHFLWSDPLGEYVISEGAVITYTDPTGGVWRSDVSGAGASITVTEVYEVSPSIGSSGWFSGTFTGVLKKDGVAKAIQNGSFTGALVTD